MGQGASARPMGLWTTLTRPIGFTSFFLIYGADAVLPKEIGYASSRVRAYDEDTAEEALQDSLDRLDEHHRMALVRSARYQQQLRKYHSKHVQELNIMQGNLFLRRVQTTKGKNKFTPPWEGPFIVAKVLRSRTYKLANMKDEVYRNVWNVDLLRWFYV